ncbi:hypothetical protein NCCP2222_02020 [Sporosarcina sp. NCCP-2222]|nr:hypothetical protein [Sporosarcina sp. NCCP-2222]GKV54255.1 hypothetical protein NCCP2222_02020 [Sporosarcina sp. NCCP-2222]
MRTLQDQLIEKGLSQSPGWGGKKAEYQVKGQAGGAVHIEGMG